MKNAMQHKENHSMMKTRLRGFLLVTALAGSLVSLQGCFPLVAAGVATGTLAAADRRTTGAQLEDKTIELKAGSRIGERFKDGMHVNVNSYNRRVLLTGEVFNEQMKAEVEKIAAGVENVASVINELEVQGTTSFTSRSNDALITGKVKASFVDTKELFANAFKVSTERGIVYLQGRVTQAEGDRAADVASRVGGVTKVVKVLDYITEEELRQLKTLSAPSDGNAPKK